MRVNIKMEQKTVRQLEANLTKSMLGALDVGKKAAEDVAKSIMRQSEMEVPADTFTLQSSAFIQNTENGVRFGYGGPKDRVNSKTGQAASEYMYYVHENPFARHKKGKWKFLEDPIINHIGIFRTTLAGRIRAFFGGR